MRWLLAGVGFVDPIVVLVVTLASDPSAATSSPDGSVRQRYSKTPLTREQVGQGMIAPR
jgi:hypothetical protein